MLAFVCLPLLLVKVEGHGLGRSRYGVAPVYSIPGERTIESSLYMMPVPENSLGQVNTWRDEMNQREGPAAEHEGTYYKMYTRRVALGNRNPEYKSIHPWPAVRDLLQPIANIKFSLV